MAADPIPEGYITLKEAFDTFRGTQPQDSDFNALLAVIITPFERRELEAFVRFPGSEENQRLTPESWDEQVQPLSHRPFMAGEIGNAAGTPWERFAGHVPFVREQLFNSWLEKAGSTNASMSKRPPAEPNPAKAEEYLRQHAHTFIQDKGPRHKHREWLAFAESTFGLSNAKANKIWQKMPDSYRGGVGRPRKK